jgi:hypothetical protein
VKIEVAIQAIVKIACLVNSHNNKYLMKKIKTIKLTLRKHTISKLSKVKIIGGLMDFATQSDQAQTGCNTNCQTHKC